jgi:hypothetical protein
MVCMHSPQKIGYHLSHFACLHVRSDLYVCTHASAIRCFVESESRALPLSTLVPCGLDSCSFVPAEIPAVASQSLYGW